MSVEAPALIVSAARDIDNPKPLLNFSATDTESLKAWYRFLAVANVPVFEVGNICGTCQFWFRRLEPAMNPIEMVAVQQSLTDGLDQLDEDVVSAFGNLLESGAYQIALFRVATQRVEPGRAADYFSAEQAVDWRDYVYEDPIDPGTSYYRVSGRSQVPVDAEGRAFDFIVPLQSPETLVAERISYFDKRLQEGAAPTAVAVGVLDIKQHWDRPTAHWCLSHYLLDGHHKVEAAARAGKPLTLLSFIAVHRGIASEKDIRSVLSSYRNGD